MPFKSQSSKLLFASIFIWLITACSQDGSLDVAEKKNVKPVRTMTVALGSTISKSFNGVVDAIKTAELGFRVSGELKSVKIKEGDSVKKGQVLASLDQTDFKISLSSAQAEFDRAKSEFDRAQSLIKQGAISRADFDKLKAQKSSAQAQLDSAKQNLKYTVLKAPFSGVIAKQYVSNFEKISSTEKFAAIQDLSAFEVKIDIPESVMITIKRDEEDQDVFAIFDGNQSRRYPLTFKEVSTRADEKTQTYSVKFVMDVPRDINLLPGMSAKVFAVESNKDGLNQDVYVPSHTVLEDSAGRFVYVVNLDGLLLGKVARRSVVVGALNENGIQVVQGLEEGDQVITAGMSKVSPGLVVKLMGEVK